MAGEFSTGRIAIAICGRCSVKMPYTKLMADGNSPGLRVCKDCRDPIDPYRLPARQPDAFTLRNPRPDLPLNGLPDYIIGADGFPIVTGSGGFLEQ